jgi:hypothetical protein
MISSTYNSFLVENQSEVVINCPNFGDKLSFYAVIINFVKYHNKLQAKTRRKNSSLKKLDTHVYYHMLHHSIQQNNAKHILAVFLANTTPNQKMPNNVQMNFFSKLATLLAHETVGMFRP